MASMRLRGLCATLLFSVVSVVSASNQSCTKVTLPNVLGFGDCLHSPVDMCICNTNITQFAEMMLLCAVHGMSHFDVPSQLYFLQSIMKEVTDSLLLNPLMNLLNGFCLTGSSAKDTFTTVGSPFLKDGNTLFGNLAEQIGNFGRAIQERFLGPITQDRSLLGGLLDPIFGGGSSESGGSSQGASASSFPSFSFGQCSKPDVGSGVTCGTPAEVFFPSELNLEKCQSTTTKCDGTNQVLVVQQLFLTVECIYFQVLATSSLEDKKRLYCMVLLVLKYMLNAGTAGIFSQILNFLGGAIEQKCQSISL